MAYGKILETLVLIQASCYSDRCHVHSTYLSKASRLATQITLTCIWLETMIYGANGCMFVLFNLRQPLNRSISHRIPSKTILFACTFLFTTATVHVVLSFIQLLRAFTNEESAIAAADTYLTSNQFITPNAYIYIFNGIAQFLLFIWRLYMVAGHTWKPCIIPLIILAADASCSFASASLIGKGGVVTTRAVRGLTSAGFTIGFCLNAGLSGGISYYLWAAQRRTGGLFGREHNPYKTAMLLVVESGALIASCELVMMCLAYVGNAACIMATSVAIQVATASPLLIVVRVGMSASTRSTHQTTDSTIFRFGNPVAVDVHIDTVRPIDGPNAYPMQLSSKSKREDPREGSLKA
ncbi:hypothetical protein SERLA73DRAFT_189089 [Serpula lacrymans var. lacrymans S7.3]|uniref:Uncharacterized protein n=1 Tax=Serpula lacrymans var. lacrymans (strain S7.3) TaxID=936435 RepID=F8QCU0_SERL3|nr:hypothetical protein SERLA73DRAFT_189089 [Serpula lacrymans var. lacrymans S7.3]